MALVEIIGRNNFMLFKMYFIAFWPITVLIWQPSYTHHTITEEIRKKEPFEGFQKWPEHPKLRKEDIFSMNFNSPVCSSLVNECLEVTKGYILPWNGRPVRDGVWTQKVRHRCDLFVAGCRSTASCYATLSTGWWRRGRWGLLPTRENRKECTYQYLESWIQLQHFFFFLVFKHF